MRSIVEELDTRHAIGGCWYGAYQLINRVERNCVAGGVLGKYKMKLLACVEECTGRGCPSELWSGHRSSLSHGEIIDCCVVRIDCRGRRHSGRIIPPPGYQSAGRYLMARHLP
jgi:hypothetical protein